MGGGLVALAAGCARRDMRDGGDAWPAGCVELETCGLATLLCRCPFLGGTAWASGRPAENSPYEIQRPYDALSPLGFAPRHPMAAPLAPTRGGIRSAPWPHAIAGDRRGSAARGARPGRGRPLSRPGARHRAHARARGAVDYPAAGERSEPAARMTTIPPRRETATIPRRVRRSRTGRAYGREGPGAGWRGRSAMRRAGVHDAQDAQGRGRLRNRAERRKRGAAGSALTRQCARHRARDAVGSPPRRPGARHRAQASDRAAAHRRG